LLAEKNIEVNHFANKFFTELFTILDPLDGSRLWKTQLQRRNSSRNTFAVTEIGEALSVKLLNGVN